MLALHETTQRRICRVGFFLLCVLPTVAVTAAIVTTRLPSHQVARLEEASSALGMNVTGEHVWYPRPGMTVYDQIQLRHTQSGFPLGTARSVEVTQDSKGIIIVLEQAEIETEHLQDLLQTLESRLLAKQLKLSGSINLLARELTLQDGDDARTLTDVIATAIQDKDSSQATLAFRLAGVEMEKPAQLRFSREMSDDEVRKQFELHTGGAKFPCRVLQSYLPSLQQLGSNATFQGAMSLVQQGGHWSGSLAGRFRDIDLNVLIGQAFRHRLSGTAELTLTDVQFERGKLTQVKGTLSAGPGTIGGSLLEAAADHLDILPAKPLQEQLPQLIRYRELAFGFQIGEKGLNLRGQCQGEPAASLLTDEAGRRFLASEGSDLSVLALVRTLVPQSGVQVPATRETNFLLQALPVPAIEALQDAPRAPQSHIRFHQPEGP